MSSRPKEYFSIRQVIEITGLSEFTLRGWENRYHAFRPQRTDTGRRLYTLQDIEKARLLDELVASEHRISDIAHLTMPELKKLITTNTPESCIRTENSEADKFLKLITDKAQLFSWDEIKDLLDKKRKAGKTESYVRNILMPLVGHMGYLVAEGQFTVAQEHILSALVKEQLVLLRAKSRKNKSQSRLVITTPEGYLHDMGIVISATLAADQAIHTLFLGPSTPKSDLCESCIRYKGTHLLLSSTVSEREGAKESLYAYMNFLDKNLPRKVHFLIAGRNTADFNPKIDRPMTLFKTMDEFIEFLKNLD
jgi:DNA-binding transcriptional MerR regulator